MLEVEAHAEVERVAEALTEGESVAVGQKEGEREALPVPE